MIDPRRFPISRYDLAAIASASRRLAAMRRAGKSTAVPPATASWANDSAVSWSVNLNSGAFESNEGSDTSYGWSWDDEAKFTLTSSWWVVMHASARLTVTVNTEGFTGYKPFKHNVRLRSGGTTLASVTPQLEGPSAGNYWLGSGNLGEPDVSAFRPWAPTKAPGHGRCLTIIQLDPGTYTFGSYFSTTTDTVTTTGYYDKRGTLSKRRGAIAALRPA